MRIWWGIGAVILIGAIAISAYILRDTLTLQSQITKYTNELNQDPNNFDAAFGLGSAYFRAKKYALSVESYTKATQIRPTSAESFNNLANGYRKLGRLQDAEQAYLRALDLAPSYVTAYTNITNLYQTWGKSDTTKLQEIPKILEKGIAQNPKNPVLLQTLIDYYKGAGEQANAKKYQKLLDSL